MEAAEAPYNQVIPPPLAGRPRSRSDCGSVSIGRRSSKENAGTAMELESMLAIQSMYSANGDPPAGKHTQPSSSSSMCGPRVGGVSIVYSCCNTAAGVFNLIRTGLQTPIFWVAFLWHIIAAIRLDLSRIHHIEMDIPIFWVGYQKGGVTDTHLLGWLSEGWRYRYLSYGLVIIRMGLQISIFWVGYHKDGVADTHLLGCVSIAYNCGNTAGFV